jgi:hypothetical protein
MLRITPAGMERAREEVRRNAVENLADWLLREYPQAGVARSQLAAEVRPVANTAWSWGVEDGELLRLHVLASKVLGTDYHAVAPTLGAMLADRALTDRTKRAWLGAWLQALRDDQGARRG